MNEKGILTFSRLCVGSPESVDPDCKDFVWLHAGSHIDIVLGSHCLGPPTGLTPWRLPEGADRPWWYGFRPGAYEVIQWRVYRPSSHVIASRITPHEWEVLYLGPENAESHFLRCLLEVNGGVAGVEVLSARNNQIRRFLKGEVVQSAEADAALAKKFGPYWPLINR